MTESRQLSNRSARKVVRRAPTLPGKGSRGTQRGTEPSSGEKAAETLGSRLRLMMAEKGISQAALAAKTGINRVEINRLINNKRSPKQQEIPLLAEALGVTLDSMLSGLQELPAELQEKSNEFEKLARRVLDVESKREEALAQKKSLEEQLDAQRVEWEQVRNELSEEIAQLQRQVSLLEAAKTTAQATAHQLQAERDELARKVFELDKTAKLLSASNTALRGQVQQLQQQISGEEGKKVATGLLAGLAGLFVGGVLSSSGSNRDPDD